MSAIIAGPLAAVLITVWLQNRKAKRDARLTILSTLVSLRHSVVSYDSVRALNLIDLVFHDVPRVRKLWAEYFDMLCNAGLNNPVGWTQRNAKNVELITAMASELGLGRSISALDVQRIYSPVGLGEFESRQIEIQQELVRVLKSTGSLAFEPRSDK
jgi:hypothetical protein